MTQCCYKTNREDPRTFPKSMPYQHPNCCVWIRKEHPNNIPMLREYIIKTYFGTLILRTASRILCDMFYSYQLAKSQQLTSAIRTQCIANSACSLKHHSESVRCHQSPCLNFCPATLLMSVFTTIDICKALLNTWGKSVIVHKYTCSQFHLPVTDYFDE